MSFLSGYFDLFRGPLMSFTSVLWLCPHPFSMFPLDLFLDVS